MAEYHSSNLWKSPPIILNILKNVLATDPLPILGNDKVHYLKDSKNFISYCVLTKHKNFQILRDVFTFEKYRNKGHASTLIKQVLFKQIHPTYLICYLEKQSFYKKFGFKKTQKAPLIVSSLQKVSYFLSKLFSQKRVIAMKFEKRPNVFLIS